MSTSCFISYSNDSPPHVKWVKRFAQKIRQEVKAKRKDIDVKLDQFDTHLGSDLVKFMTEGVKESNRVILICTPTYCKKTEGGAAFEKMLMAAELAKDAFTDKFLPVLKEGDKDKSIPSFLHSKQYISMPGKRIITADISKIVNALLKVSSTKGARIKKIKYSSKKKSIKVVPTITDISDVSRIRLSNYSLLGGRGADGIRYLWKTQDGSFTESAAFNMRVKAFEIAEEDKKVSAYTTSVGFGCQLQPMKKACCFCATGRLTHKGVLSAQEIALQNIFMAGYDAECPSWPEVRTNSREFAFMGQGEPGLCYAQVRKAIFLTDKAMEILNQQVHRYIIATCGIPEMLDQLVEDFRRKVFNNRVTLHFSLHAVDRQRTDLMPINSLYPYDTCLSKIKEIFEITRTKIAIGILLFENFSSKPPYRVQISSTEKYLDNVLNKLDPKIHRIDLCDVNRNSKAISDQHEVSNETAQKLLSHVKNRGFEVKLFSSFGTDKNSGCGMLASSKSNVQTPGITTIKNFEKAVSTLRSVIKELG